MRTADRDPPFASLIGLTISAPPLPPQPTPHVQPNTAKILRTGGQRLSRFLNGARAFGTPDPRDKETHSTPTRGGKTHMANVSLPYSRTQRAATIPPERGVDQPACLACPPLPHTYFSTTQRRKDPPVHVTYMYT